MKNSTRILLCVSIALASLSTHTMELKKSGNYNTYKGIPLTSESILQFLPHMPEELSKEVLSWVASNKSKLMYAASMPKIKSESEVRSVEESNKQFVQSVNVNYSNKGSNYIFTPEGQPFVAKLSRVSSKILSLFSLIHKKDPYRDAETKAARFYSDQLLNELASSDQPTYQHVSAIAHYLRLKEYNEKHASDTTGLHPLSTYLALLDENNSTFCDKNYLTVQEIAPSHIVPFSTLDHQEKSTALGSINDQALRQIHGAIQYAALWDIKGNVWVNKNNSQSLVITDLEQPNNSGPFFYSDPKKGRSKYNHDVWAGLGGSEWRGAGMLELLKEHGASKQCSLWQTLSEQTTKDLGEGP